MPTRFLLISNELPRFGDASGAIANRFVVLTLRQSWLGRENIDLTSELRTELPGILSWALDGLERLGRQGRFTEPASSKDAMLTLADLVSPASAFVRDRCETGPGEGGREVVGRGQRAPDRIGADLRAEPASRAAWPSHGATAGCRWRRATRPVPGRQPED